jgi:hypothetical protein
MKNTQKVKQFSNRKSKNRKSKKRTIGGVGEQPPEPIETDVCTKKVDYRTTYLKNDITNIEMLVFIIGLLGDTDFKSKVIDKNAVYLNSITSDTIGTSFNYFDKQEYRVFLNHIIQWLLLDYNQDFFNSVLTVLSKSFERPDFLTNKDPFNVILFELDSTITEKTNNNQNPQDNKVANDPLINNNIVLLKIILEVLTTIPNLSNALKSYFQNADNINILRQYLSSIKCILTKLIKMDIKTNTNVRNLITGYFSDQNVGLFGTIKAALPIIGGCGGSVVSNVAKGAASSVFSFFTPSNPVNTNHP